MAVKRTDFSPVLHGFKFTNRFDFPDFFQFKLPFIRVVPLSLAEVIYGLCGGMCFAALDYFHSNVSVPEFTSPDDISLRLFYYLWEKQLQSLDSKVLRKVFKWMILEDNMLSRIVNQWEIPKLRAKIDSGSPAVMLLIRVKGISDPTQNHQVIACGYEEDPATKEMKIHLYDPNHPRIEPTLSMNLSKPTQGIHLTQSTGEPLRGFFVLDYQVDTPP